MSTGPMPTKRVRIVRTFFFPPCPACNGRPYKTLSAMFPMPEDELRQTIAQLKEWSENFYTKHFAEHHDEIDDELEEFLEGG